VNVFFEKLKEKEVLLDEKGFCKEGFVLKIVSNRRDKDKPSKGLVCYIKVSYKVYNKKSFNV
jgi:hypothetical protein